MTDSPAVQKEPVCSVGEAAVMSNIDPSFTYGENGYFNLYKVF